LCKTTLVAGGEKGGVLRKRGKGKTCDLAFLWIRRNREYALQVRGRNQELGGKDYKPLVECANQCTKRSGRRCSKWESGTQGGKQGRGIDLAEYRGELF